MSESTPKPPPRRKGLAERMVDAVVTPIVSPIVTAVDVDDVVERIDVAQVIERIDIDHVVDRVDIDRVIARVDINSVLDRIDPDALLSRIDPDALLRRVDPNALLDRVDPNALLDRVDPNALLDRVDPDRLLDRVDANRLLDRVDPDRLMARVDLDAVMARVDVNEIVKRTELGAIIARSTTGVFGELLDTGRSVTLSIDQIVQGTFGRLLRPGGKSRPGLPSDLDDDVDIASMSLRDRGVAVQGRLSGSLSRFLAFLIDQLLLGLLFVWAQGLFALAVSVVTGRSFQPTDHRWLVAISYTLWAFLYFAVPLAAASRTVGMAVLGLRVVRADGARIGVRQAIVRTVAFPLSFLIFGIGLLIGLFRRDRRELHDLIAGTAVIYAWDAELARMRDVGGP